MKNEQMKKGVLTILILKRISISDTYGYEIKTYIQDMFHVNESSVYTSLQKLRKAKYIEAYLKESDQGPARKYFRITETGKAELERQIESWNSFSESITEALNK